MISTVETPANYGGLVDAQLVREALNLEASAPSNAALIFRIEESAKRIEGLTRLVLAESVWLYEIFYEDFLEHGTQPSAFRLPGLYAPTVDPTVTVTDEDGYVVVVTSTVEGMGDSILLRTTTGTFLDYELPLTIEITRGVSASQLPGDLRAAVITMVEQLNDGFSPLAEASIVRICSRYGWVG